MMDSMTIFRRVRGPSNFVGDEEFEGRSLLHSLEWFIRLRWAFIAASVSVLAVEHYAIPSFSRPAAVPETLFALAVVNLVWWGVAHGLRVKTISLHGAATPSALTLRLFANGQIAFDLLFLTILVRSTGGIESPLAIFYVFHMALGPLLLPARQALGQGLWALALYAAVALGELFGAIAPHYSLLPTLDDRSLYLRPMYVSVALGAVACCLIGTVYLTATIAARLRTREDSLRQVNESLHRSQTAIRDLQARRSRFMQTAAHRLKSPLATVQTLATLISDGVVRDAGPTYQRITRCCNEGIAHVAELLTLARVQDADPRRHRDSQTEVGAVVTDICARQQPVAAAKGINLLFTIPDGIDLRVRVDPRDLTDCIENVVDNAIKFTQAPGAVSIRLEREQSLGGAESAQWVVVHVDDTGIGFDAESPEIANAGGGASIFDAYRRGNNALTAGIPGSGLGLAIVRVVVEQAGGSIEVQSAKGSGTQFTLRYPALSTAESAPAVRNTRATIAQLSNADISVAATGEDNDAQQPPKSTREVDHALCH